MRKLALLLALLSPVIPILAQIAPEKYFVEFTDKNGSSYSIDRPWEFLTQRSIDRRANQSISITQEDIPVVSAYVDALVQIGVVPYARSKWFNGVIVQTSDPALIDSIEQLPFVSKVIRNTPSLLMDEIHDKFSTDLQFTNSPNLQNSKTQNLDYGPSFTQIHMVKGDMLHNLGYRGEGKVIAVLDGGFAGADTIPAFDSLRAGGQILGSWDFVSPGPNVYHSHPHGTMVLSVMGGNIPGVLVGTAPKASYWLLRSEDTGSEYLVEEYNWVAAAEFADSVGADIINSSLGYTVFWDTLQNHTCEDMDGNTTPVTRGANRAAAKGIMVVNSAGNSGGSNWKCVGAPSDGLDVVAVAAVDSMGNYAFFSSTGTVNGTRVKPNVAAMGQLTFLSYSDGTVGRSNGTSFSSPVIAGMMACAWQALPQLTRKQLQTQVETSASQYSSPDSLLGYGIPNFFQLLPVERPATQSPGVTCFPNPFDDQVTIRVGEGRKGGITASLFTLDGRILGNEFFSSVTDGQSLVLSGLDPLPSGFYLLKIDWQGSDNPPSYCKLQKK